MGFKRPFGLENAKLILGGYLGVELWVMYKELT